MKKKIKEEKKKRTRVSTDSFYRFIIFTAFFLIIVVIITYVQKGEEWKLNVKVGEPAPKDVYSPFSFTFVDEEKTKEAKQREASRVYNVYRLNDSVNKKVLKEFNEFFSEINKARIKEGNANVSESINEVLSDASIKEILELKDITEFKDLAETTLSSILDTGIIDFDEKVELLDENKRAVILKRGNDENIISVYDLVSISEMQDRINKISIEKFPKKRRLRSAFVEILNHFIDANMIFAADETKLRKDTVFAETPNVEVNVKKNEIILRRGGIITEDQLMRLKEIENKIAKKKVAMGFIGVGVVALLFVIALVLYLSNFETKLYSSLKNILVINTAIIFNLLLNKVLLVFMEADIYLLPTSFAALLLAILIKPRAGIFVSIGMAVLSGVMVQNNPLVIITTLLASIIGIYSIIDIRRRSQFFIVGAVVGLINFSLIFSFSIMQEMTLLDAFYISRIGILNGFFITILLFLGLFIFENLFDITTPISLLELSDLNHPVLKRLIIEAPGTYHHSLVVSNLAESACEAIGANSLLARVGSYFHDIGKIEKAEYFTENQTSKDKSFHDNLSPRMSYFIITNHVKDGVELAKKHKLKRVITDFIVQHHGTSIVYYFYKKALDILKEDEGINVSDFRYPGPKPQSKEIAITLLADSVEAASRTLSEPTPASLRGLVDKVVNDKFLDNQLDECELTLFDLHKIKESFVRNLMAIFHTRVEYPEMINESIQGKKLNN